MQCMPWSSFPTIPKHIGVKSKFNLDSNCQYSSLKLKVENQSGRSFAGL